MSDHIYEVGWMYISGAAAPALVGTPGTFTTTRATVGALTGVVVFNMTA